MSWCGGGEISPTPGVEYLVRAIHGYTLYPGSWPPSPGLAPWAILICRSLALTRYSLVTPNRPLATCLTADRRRSPFGSGVKRSGSSPPSPVLDRPPRRFIAIARVWCASAEIEPYDIAPVENRRTMLDTGSTSSIGTGGRTVPTRGDTVLPRGTPPEPPGPEPAVTAGSSTPRIRIRPRSVISCAAWSSISLVYSA